MSSDPLDSASSSRPLAEIATASDVETKLFSPDRSGSANLRQSGNRKEKEKEKEEKIMEQHQETMIIPQSKVGAILGYGGQIIRSIRAESQASIDIGGVSDKDEREILIRGVPEAIKKARCLLQEIIREHQQERMTIPKSIVGAIIGHGGHRINRISVETEARIKIREINDNDVKVITISGAVEAVKKARYLLEREISGKIGLEGGISRCFKCNQVGHFSRECREEEALCFKCLGTGHIARNCSH